MRLPDDEGARRGERRRATTGTTTRDDGEPRDGDGGDARHISPVSTTVVGARGVCMRCATEEEKEEKEGARRERVKKVPRRTAEEATSEGRTFKGPSVDLLYTFGISDDSTRTSTSILYKVILSIDYRLLVCCSRVKENIFTHLR